MVDGDLVQRLRRFLAEHGDELVEIRRDLHAHPEVGYAEYRTSRVVARRLTAAGLRPVPLPKGTGLWADVAGTDTGTDGTGAGPVVALRADLDALPMAEATAAPYASTVPDACHACGHDVHTAALLGAGLFLAGEVAAGRVPGRVRLIFQPAEEVAGGARDVLDAGVLDGVAAIFALHCDPRLETGRVGVRPGPVTAACDIVTVRLTGPGGHTARPHLTADLVYALGKVITELPAALSRRVDPRSGLSLVWGRVSAGFAANAIPGEGAVAGTVRCLDDAAWHAAPKLIEELVESVASAYGVSAEVNYRRTIPPTVNEPAAAATIAAAARCVLGDEAVTGTPQSLGGEDFAWYLESVPGALARLGTRTVGGGDAVDLHQPIFDVDERAIAVGVKLLAATALAALVQPRIADGPR